jgi:nucleoside phosphorylase
MALQDSALAELQEAYTSGELIIFAGAGVSAAAGLPEAKRLVQLLSERAQVRGVTQAALQEISALAAERQYLEALSALKEALGGPDFCAVIERHLDDRLATEPELLEWKDKDLFKLRRMLEDRPFIMASHPSVLREKMKEELGALLQDARHERLTPLKADNAREMIRLKRSGKPQECDDSVVDAIYRATGGFPNLIAGLCRHVSREGEEPLWEPSEADLRGFAKSDVGGSAFRDIHASLPTEMQAVLDGCRRGLTMDMRPLRDHFLVAGPSAAFSASLFSIVWGPSDAGPRQEPPRSRSVRSTASPVDFCIITALQEELQAVLSKLEAPQMLDRTDSHTYYEAWIKTARKDGAVYRVIVTSLAGMGPNRASNKANAVTHRWNPRHVLLVGIGGGVEGEVAPGDVMVASHIADYTLTKEQDGQPRQIRWEMHPADANLFDAANDFTSAWQARVDCARPEPGEPRRATGIIASGGSVLASMAAVSSMKATHPKLIGVEMEGAAVAEALHATEERPRFLMVRGVSDLADGVGNTEIKARWREYACHTAATYAIELLKRGPVQALVSSRPW